MFPMIRRLLTAALLGAALLPFSACAQSGPPAKQRPATADAAVASPAAFLYRDHPPAMAFADDLAVRRDLDAAWVREQIGQAQRSLAAIRGVTPPPQGAPKNWAAYRARFIEPVRLAAGERFWRAHRAALERAEAEFGVPAAIVVGILGVETLYGRHTGGVKVMDALTTLAFDFPATHPRAAARVEFFRGELEQFLSLCQRTGTDPHSVLGSFAGAMGWPQFMPSSWVRFAIDFDGDARVDLHSSPVDAIGSVANYLKSFGWQTGLPTHYALQIDTARADLDTLLAPDILPSFGADRFQSLGAQLPPEAQGHTGLLALVELQNGASAPRYVAGTDNFYAVTRYNWSSYYAMAVIELGEAVRQAVLGRSQAQ